VSYGNAANTPRFRRVPRSPRVTRGLGITKLRFARSTVNSRSTSLGVDLFAIDDALSRAQATKGL